jgi:type IV fimbrial biogenesis protein FimT
MPRRGFTLVELLIAVAVVAILLNVAISGFGSVIQAARAAHARSALLAVLTTARTRAAYNEVDVGLCPSTNGASCDAVFHWERGWVAYADMNGSDRLDAGDVVLSRQLALGAGVQVVTSSGRRRLEFQPNGSNAGSNATFTICDRRGPAKATAIAMGNAGTYREVKPSADAVAIACAGT